MFLWILFKSTPSLLGLPIDTFDCRKVLMFSHGFHWYGPVSPALLTSTRPVETGSSLCAEKRIAGLPLLLRGGKVQVLGQKHTGNPHEQVRYVYLRS